MGNFIKYPKFEDYKDYFNGEWTIESHEYPSWSLVKEFLFPGMVFLDVGCQKGIYSKGVMDFLKLKCSVYAFDLIEFPEIIQLKKDYGDCFNFYQLAIGIEGAPAKCKINYDNNIFYDVSHCSSLDLIFKDKKIDFVKIDVDGMESGVLIGMKKILKNHSPVLMVEIESNVSMVLEYLNSFGYGHFETRNDINYFFKKKNLNDIQCNI